MDQTEESAPRGTTGLRWWEGDTVAPPAYKSKPPEPGRAISISEIADALSEAPSAPVSQAASAVVVPTALSVTTAPQQMDVGEALEIEARRRAQLISSGARVEMRADLEYIRLCKRRLVRTNLAVGAANVTLQATLAFTGDPLVHVGVAALMAAAYGASHYAQTRKTPISAEPAVVLTDEGIALREIGLIRWHEIEAVGPAEVKSRNAQRDQFIRIVPRNIEALRDRLMPKHAKKSALQRAAIFLIGPKRGKKEASAPRRVTDSTPPVLLIQSLPFGINPATFYSEVAAFRARRRV